MSPSFALRDPGGSMTVNSDCVQEVGMQGTLSSLQALGKLDLLSILNISTLRCSAQREVRLAGVVSTGLEHCVHTVARGLA